MSTEQRLEQQERRIEDMSMWDCNQEHTSNAEDWKRRVDSSNPPDANEAYYHGRLQDMLYLKSVETGNQ